MRLKSQNQQKKGASEYLREALLYATDQPLKHNKQGVENKIYSFHKF